jgi:hypothetical protein
MADKPKVILKSAVVGGEKRTTIVCKFGFDLTTVDVPGEIAGLNTIFGTVDGNSGSQITTATTHHIHDGNLNTIADPALGSESLVCIMKDDEGGVHKYQFPRPLDVNLTTEGKNEILLKVHGDTIASHISDLTGYTMTFIRGYIKQDYAN